MQTINTLSKDNYQIIQLNRGKVNAINQLMVNELNSVIREVQNNDAVGGIILTGIPHFFSAGLDVKEIFEYDEEQIRLFFSSFFELHENLVRFTKPFVCAINGHSPAGGTVLAIAADYRIMAEGEKYVIGLNEMAVNIQITQALINAYSFWIGNAKAHEYLLDGKLLHTQEALTSGLINKIVDGDDLMIAAEKQLKKYLAADPEIFSNTKRKLRSQWLSELAKSDRNELEEALNIWWKPSVRSKMKTFVESLNKR